MNRLVSGGCIAALVSAMAVVSVPSGADATTTKSAPAVKTVSLDHQGAKAQAARTADKLVATPPRVLHASAHDAFHAEAVQSSHGLQYVPYERTYRGLHVVGGDFVVVTDSAGRLLTTNVAQSKAVSLASVQPAVAKKVARKVALGQVQHGRYDGATRLVVLQQRGSHLAWETTVVGTRAGEASRLTVLVDAATAKVLSTQEHVMEGTGSSAWAGTVTIPTSGSGSSYSMTNSNASTLKCQNASGNATYIGSDDVWGDGNATNRETGCVDAFYAAEQERQMLSSWLGRNGMNGSGGWVPIRVGLNDVNAYYDGTQVQVGHTQTGSKWIGSIDVVAHEFGHGVDDKTPGGISGNGTQEFVADTFGAATEWYANNPVDTPDFTVGEQVNLVGSGPIRYMYNPSLAGDDNCYSSSTPTDEVHAAAGPGNHWFYLLAEGTSPSNGQPSSPTCNSTSITGLGIQKAITIMYNAMLMKTSSVVVPEVPHLDPHGGEEPLPELVHRVQRREGGVDGGQRAGAVIRPDLLHEHRQHRHRHQPGQPVRHRGYGEEPAGQRQRLGLGPDADLLGDRSPGRAVDQRLQRADLGHADHGGHLQLDGHRQGHDERVGFGHLHLDDLRGRQWRQLLGSEAAEPGLRVGGHVVVVVHRA